MTIYGLLGFTHGWARVLTVMCSAGTAAARAHVAAGDDVQVNAGEDRLTQYFEKRSGALDRLIESHGIVVLSKDQWDARKADLGDAIRG